MEQQLICITPEQEIRDFEKYLLFKDGTKEITINAHGENIKRMVRRIQTIDPSIQQIEDYIILNLYKKKYSYNHIVNNLASIEKYMKFKGREAKFARPKKPKRLITGFLTEAEVSRIINASKNIREKAIISLLAYSGIRNSELCNLKVCDLDLGDNTVRVIKGKNSKDRIINMSAECTRILMKYLSDFPREDNDYLFTSLKHNNKYRTWDLRKLVRVLSKRAEMNKRVYPHLFRHSLASNLLKRGASILMIQQQLGHDYLESTMIYLHSCPQRIKAEYEFYKPAYM